MSEKRFFYPAPRVHHALCMAVDFGMRLTNADGMELFPLGIGLARMAEDEDNDQKRVFAYHPSNEPVYIHPDSLHLLEPQKYDLVDFGWVHPCGQSFHELTLLRTCFEAFCEKSSCDYDSHRIIQRNGKPFHWPESEEA